MEMSRKRSREPEEAVPDGVTKKPHIVIDDLDNDLVKYLQKEGFSTDICKVFEGQSEGTVVLCLVYCLL